MKKSKKLTPHPKYKSLSFKVKETTLTTQPKCVPVNLAEEKAKFITSGTTPNFQLQDPSKLNEIASKAKNRIRFDLQGEAMCILEHVLQEYGDGEAYLEHAFGPRISKEAATPLLLEYITDNSLTESLTIHWCDNLACSAKMMWKGPLVNSNRPDLRKYSLWINGSDDNNYMRESGIQCLMDHEIGTHFFRMLNDGLQPWFSDRARFGLRRTGSFESKCTEEGLATINTILRGRVKLLWGAAFAYYTACKSTEMTFKQLFDHIGRYTSNPNYRWKQVMRVKRGLTNTNDLGGFGNDQCYFEGAVTILRNMENIDFYLLMSGKVCYDEVDRIKRVVRKDCLRYPSFMRKVVSYRKALKKIYSLNRLGENLSINNAPTVCLENLDEQTTGNSADGKQERKKLQASKTRQKNASTCKSNRKTEKTANTDKEDDESDIENFATSNQFVKIRQYQSEEAKRKEETCQIYQRFECVNNKLTALDVTFDQKIKSLKDIVKDHNWSSNDTNYQQHLFQQASCELMQNLQTPKEDVCTVSALSDILVKETNSSDNPWPKSSQAVKKQPKKVVCKIKVVNKKLQTLNAEIDYNTNSSQSRYFKKNEKPSSMQEKQEGIPLQSSHKKKKKKKDEVLTDSVINQRLNNFTDKFTSEVKPYEVIFLEISDVEIDDSGETMHQYGNSTIDINEKITTVLSQKGADGNGGASVDAGGGNSKTEQQHDANLNKCNVQSGTKQVPNFILRNKLLNRRPSINSAVNSGKFGKQERSLDKKNSNERDSDSDDYAPRRINVPKNPYANVVSRYAQIKHVETPKPKLDREILTADLCKPFFIQAERLLQAEKVLKKTRSRHRSCKSSL